MARFTWDASRTYEENIIALHAERQRLYYELRARERERDREARRKFHEEQETLWKQGMRSKPRWLRHGTNTRQIGCDTRRYRADGKLLGGHHGKLWGDKTSISLTRVERSIKSYITYCHLHEVEHYEHRIHMSVDWDERRPQLY